ncbi:MAG: leucyl/phenylalanyl-tRNA--protein transferase [Spirochaetota bacterium]
MIPRELLPYVLDRSFPLVAGPDDLDRVVPLLEERGGEFCASLRTDPEMVAACCHAGFLPMSEDQTGHEVLLVKSHRRRCVLAPGELHRSKSTRRRARGLTVRVDHDFARCLDEVVRWHPDRWLTDPLCASLAILHREPRYGVRARSVEVYDDDALVAGEVGYSCGLVYTSMAAFHGRSGSGSVQLAALGVLLRDAGFALWDLGMEMEYKRALGARVTARRPFLELFRSYRDRPTPALAREADCASLLRRPA